MHSVRIKLLTGTRAVGGYHAAKLRRISGNHNIIAYFPRNARLPIGLSLLQGGEMDSCWDASKFRVLRMLNTKYFTPSLLDKDRQFLSRIQDAYGECHGLSQQSCWSTWTMPTRINRCPEHHIANKYSRTRCRFKEIPKRHYHCP